MKNKAENSRTGNSRSLDQSYIWKDAAGLITKELGKSVGSERLYVNLDIIPPGAFSATYHSHSCQEEFFYILSGTGRYQDDDRFEEVAAGAVTFTGDGHGHGLANTGTDNLVFMALIILGD